MREPTHGTYREYNVYRCRCPECKAANTAHALMSRDKRTNKPLPEGRQHGVYTTYINYGCRCEECSAVAKGYRRSYSEGVAVRRANPDGTTEGHIHRGIN